MNTATFEASSFRDPSGIIYERDDELLRQINQPYEATWSSLNQSGFLTELQCDGLLVQHEDRALHLAADDRAIAVIAPERVPFISYPYEWSFSQLKDAALLTLELQQRSLAKGYVLKDASAYNIQFLKGKPILIDTLSFEPYREGEPWIAYRQFCEHFMAPLVLMSKVDVGLGRLGSLFVDGVPVELAAKLLPKKTRWHLGLAMHVHAHAGAKRRAAASEQSTEAKARISLAGLKGLIGSLQSTVKSLELKAEKSTWSDYYSETSYSDSGMASKLETVAKMVDRIEPKPRQAWDLGANTGRFSRLLSSRGVTTVSFDLDPYVVEANYLRARRDREENLLPLVMDLTNPSASIGWANSERKSLASRGPVGLVLALALVHHLAIVNNVPLPAIAAYLADLGAYAIVEFVPKVDPQTQRLLANREDIFESYTLSEFLQAFQRHFELEESVEVPDSERSIHLFRKR